MLSEARRAEPGGGSLNLKTTGEFGIRNGLTGVRITTGKGFADETAGLEAGEITRAEQHESNLFEVKRKHRITPVNPAPVQGIQLRDGTWTANGPNMLHAKALCSGLQVEFIESGADFIMANDMVAGHPGTRHTELSNEAKLKIAAALDHLRQLGEADLQFKSGTP